MYWGSGRRTTSEDRCGMGSLSWGRLREMELEEEILQ
jgi:hypothetical protein